MQDILTLDYPLFVKWYITSRCNLRCAHCYLTDYTIHPPLEKVLPFIDHLASKGVRMITLLGGEPLVRDDLDIIIDRIRKAGMNTHIATNGMLATEQKATRLMNAGATTFQVSLEGANAQINDAVRGLGTFLPIQRGIETLVKAGARVTIAATLTKSNQHTLNDLFALTDRLGAQVLRLNAYMPVGTGEAIASDLLSHVEVRQARESVSHLKTLYPSIKVDPGFFSPQSIVSFDRMPQKKSTFGCGAGTNTLIINSDFTVSACDLLMERDRSLIAASRPEDIDRAWKEDAIFLKWRGRQQQASLGRIASFADVHQHGCHLAHHVYGKEAASHG